MNNHAQHTLGTVLFIIGLVLLVLFTTSAMIKPATEKAVVSQETRDAEAATALANAEKSRTQLISELTSLVKYYQKNGLQDREAKYQAVLDEAESGAALSDESFNTVKNFWSVSGQEEEVQHIYMVYHRFVDVRAFEKTAADLKAAPVVEKERFDLMQSLAALPITGRVLLFVFSVFMIALGLILNHSYTMKTTLGKVLLYTLLIVGAVFMVFPFYWMITSSLKTRMEVSKFPPVFTPSSWINFENYRVAFHTAPFAQYFFNSIVVCFFSVLIVTFTTVLASFAFTRLKFPGRDAIFSGLLTMMMLPFEMLVITNFRTVINLGLRDTLTALVIPFISSIFYTYIMRNFFASIPESLYWSARVDGCKNWKYLWRVMVPIARPSLVTVVLLNALASWNSFMWPLLVITSTGKRTLPFGLYAFTTEAGSYQELIMAAATVVVFPMIILFLFARKQILRGVARGGLKG